MTEPRAAFFPPYQYAAVCGARATQSAMNIIVGVLLVLVFVALAVYLFAPKDPNGGANGGANGGGDVEATTAIVKDGGNINLACLGDSHFVLLSASYGPAPDDPSSCLPYDAMAALKGWTASHPHGGSLSVAPDLFPKAPPCPGPRQLTMKHTCADGAKATFVPLRENTCSNAQDMLPVDTAPAFHLWTGQDNKNWTADVVPWDPDSQIQLTAAALTPGSRREFLPINPITRVGVTDRVPTWDNPFTPYGDPSGPCSRAASLWGVQPFAPGFMEPAANDSTDGTPYDRRTYYQPSFWDWPVSSIYGGPYEALGPGCPAGDEIGIGGPTEESKRTYIRPDPIYFGDWINVEGEVPPEVEEAVGAWP